MKKFLNILRWVAVGFLATMSLGALFSGGLGFIGAILLALSGLLLMPISFVYQLRQKLKLNKVISIVLIVVLFVFGAMLIPTDNTTDNNSSSIELNDDVSSNTSEVVSDNSSSNPISSNSSQNDVSNTHESTSSTTTSNAKPSTTDSSKTNPSASESIHTHSYKEATCTTPKKCSTCGATEGSAKGHSWVEATYTAPKTCSNCKITEGESLPIPNSENYHGHVYTGGSSSTKYHYEAQCAGKNSHEITWDEVSKRNLGPCGTCVLK